MWWPRGRTALVALGNHEHDLDGNRCWDSGQDLLGEATSKRNGVRLLENFASAVMGFQSQVLCETDRCYDSPCDG